MRTVVLTLSSSDGIQLFSAISSLIASIVAIIISLKTLKQNSRMIEENTRPNLIVYNDIVSAHSPIQYLILKNYGNSAAVIDRLAITYDGIPELSDSFFAYMEGKSVAPGQSFTTAFRFKNSDTKMRVVLEYHSAVGKHYSEEYQISQKSLIDHVHAKTAPKDDSSSLRIIAESFQDLLRSRL